MQSNHTTATQSDQLFASIPELSVMNFTAAVSNLQPQQRYQLSIRLFALYDAERTNGQTTDESRLREERSWRQIGISERLQPIGLRRTPEHYRPNKGDSGMTPKELDDQHDEEWTDGLIAAVTQLRVEEAKLGITAQNPSAHIDGMYGGMTLNELQTLSGKGPSKPWAEEILRRARYSNQSAADAETEVKPEQDGDGDITMREAS